MKKHLALFLIAGLLSCHKDEPVTINPDPALGSVVEATGRLSNYAAIDGCGILLTIQKDSVTFNEYAISEKSDSLVKHYLVYERGYADLKATFQFQHTNRKKDVQCGWAGFKPFDEVLLLSIKPI
ncbi:hypothetical protein [Spirosoma spitsbergense]|jgi:hypothetical protein|uniref:hypothetical protein n=1 Tax=Spirosoma spitsbergense TaxID=431554 RepID=UPI00037FEFFC|nr:hypothetical protein [Spirosoma spitsbergense]